MRISIYPNRFATAPSGSTTVDNYLEDIKNGVWQDLVLAIRNGTAEKDKAPGVTVSALFEANRKNDSVKEHSGFLAIDLDEDDNPDLLEKRAALEADRHCYACHHSIRGFGLVWYVKVQPDRHLDAFQAIERHLANTYNVVVDPSGKNVSRLRYISYDPALYQNQKSLKWSKYVLKKDIPKPVKMPYHDDDMAYIMDQIGGGINIAEDYHTWLRAGFALANEFGEQGRAYFHTVSAQSAKYKPEASDKQFDISLKKSDGSVGIGTFFYYCREAGVDIKTKQTELIESVARLRLKSMGKSGDRKEAMKSAREYLEKMEGLPSDRIGPVLDKMESTPIAQLKDQKVDDQILEIENFIKGFGMRFNIITRKIEMDGHPLDDYAVNTIYRKALHAIDPKIRKQLIIDMMESDIVPQFNPILEFFENNKHLKPEGRIQEVLECFDYEKPDISLDQMDQDELDADYLEVFLTRWLISIISAAHGTYSLLVLVLTGSQGTGKSKFFRELLPPDLLPYYGESKLDKEKDDGILMCQKLILMDDEFAGKNKREATKFKEISSRETFTVRRPYGRSFEDLQRLAVLCGTSNECEVLNDPTGNRRLIPVNVRAFDHKRFSRIDKTELFMELYHQWKEIGDAWMLTSKEIAYLNKSTATNELVSFEAEMLSKWFEPSDREGGNTIFLTTSEIKNRIDSRTMERINLYRLGGALKKHGYVRMKKAKRYQSTYGYLVIDHYKGGENEGETEPIGEF